MSNANQLQKEIEYWSVLIKQHKEAKKNVKQKTDSSKYLWKKSEKVEKGTTANTPTSSSQSSPTGHQIQRKRVHPGVSQDAQSPKKTAILAPTSSIKASTTRVAFQSKFKWMKQPLQNSQSTSSLAKVVPTPKQLSIKPNVVSLLKTDTKNIECNTSSSSDALTSEKTKIKPLLQEANRPVLNHLVSKTSKYKYVGPGLEKQIEIKVNIPKPKQAVAQTAKWNPNSHYRWSGTKRSSSKYKIHNDASKWTSKKHSLEKKSNPYKLNRSSKPQAIHHRRKTNFAPSHKVLNRYNRRNGSLVLDRRNKEKNSVGQSVISISTAEGPHLHKHSPTVKQMLANRAVVKSHQLTRSKKHEKKNQHCLYFGRFGKCMRGSDCKFIHDPSRIAICTRFLRGTCRDENCSFSHRLEKEKTPVCMFFLRGKCNLPNCPYLHVYLGKDAPVCRKFATTGYCPDADKCKMQHIKCCPDYYETGSCPKEKECRLPHLARKTHSTNQKSKRKRTKSTDSETTSLPSASENKPSTSESSTFPDFLSLKVDSPQPINKPFKGTVMKIKPQIKKIKPISDSRL